MDRLTIPDEPIDGGMRRAVIDCRAVKEQAMTIYWRLKAYEDTGLEPCEIPVLLDRLKRASEQWNIWCDAYQKDVPVWIPVAEQLPGIERILITDGEIVKEGYRRPDGIWKYGVKEDELFSNLSSKGVIAWMPLPEPYRPETLRDAGVETAQDAAAPVLQPAT